MERGEHDVHPEMCQCIDVHCLLHHWVTTVQDLLSSNDSSVVYQNVDTAHFWLHLTTHSFHHNKTSSTENRTFTKHQQWTRFIVLIPTPPSKPVQSEYSLDCVFWHITVCMAQHRRILQTACGRHQSLSPVAIFALPTRLRCWCRQLVG